MDGKTRAGLIALVGAYMVYIVYSLFTGEEDGSMPPALRIVFMVFFSLAAIALFVYSFFLWKNSKKKDGDQPPDDMNELK